MWKAKDQICLFLLIVRSGPSLFADILFVVWEFLYGTQYTWYVPAFSPRETTVEIPLWLYCKRKAFYPNRKKTTKKQQQQTNKKTTTKKKKKNKTKNKQTNKKNTPPPPKKKKSNNQKQTNKQTKNKQKTNKQTKKQQQNNNNKKTKQNKNKTIYMYWKPEDCFLYMLCVIKADPSRVCDENTTVLINIYYGMCLQTLISISCESDHIKGSSMSLSVM